MDLLGTIKSVTGEDVETAVAKLDAERADLRANILTFCADSDIEAAWDCLVHYDKVTQLKDFVCGLKIENKEE